MMRVFVYEFITGGGLVDRPLPAFLAEEGEIMARALLRDLAEVPGVAVVAMRDPRAAASPPGVEIHVPRDAPEATRLFARCVETSDATWIVAPETDGVLERLSAAALALGGRLLGSRPAAIAVAASKARTAAVLARHGVPVVPVFARSEVAPSLAGRVVLKPDDGVGCVDTRIYGDIDSACKAWDVHGRDRALVLQPFVEGEAASLSLLVRDGQAVVLAVNRQHVTQHQDTLLFRGVSVNALASRQASLADLAQGVAEALPGLWGYAGVDLILTADQALVLEVNPRLTISYAGLRESISANPAAWVCGLLDEDAPLPAPPKALRSVAVGSVPRHVVA